MQNYIIITGNPIEGLSFVGPFDDIEAAVAWAEEALPEYGSWYVSEIEEPL